ncbi:hypothetical protein MGYG_03793 [Nannizzia gypsea CBS 118893]|uniref:Myb-like domain-containing protein n=1 Tax=Arthroderma gypseum (strain ATCC MYA-4604 / CBS 118893) TaxID=535722 RepID=E4UTY3_ARTGP|nr:hypothetical protein MGYG_03793 [Nannizzia gypsea CBS 118893]EFR00789.1 hypothetical protein MGYG_03793 [Nannizzia gypsea CBS 118893]
MATRKGDVVAAAPKAAKKPKKVLNRPPTRSIVRWCDELDRKLLLAIQSACNKCNIRIPWIEVALMMGSNITDGAIIQHLAKLRIRMVELGQDVPPPLRRSGGSAQKPAETDMEDTLVPKPAATRKANSRKKGPKRSIYDSGDESYDDGNEPDKKPKAKKGKSAPKKNNNRTESVPIKIEQEAEDGSTTSELREIESSNENHNQQFVGGGEDFANFEYQHSESIHTPPNDESSHHGELPVTQDVTYDEETANATEVSNGGVEASPFLIGNETHPASGIEAQAIPSANNAVVGTQQALPIGIGQVVPHAYAPHHDSQTFPTHHVWTGTQASGNHFETPQQFPIDNFGFIHSTVNPIGAFTQGFQALPAQGHLQHGSHLPFVPMHSAPLNSASMSFTSSNTSLASSMLEDEGLMQAGVLDHNINWAMNSAREAEIEHSFNEFIQQL